MTPNIDPSQPPADGATPTSPIAECCPPPPWMPIAIKEEKKGVTEKLPGQHPDIIKYHSVTTGRYQQESTSWCGSFVAWCLIQSGITELSTVPERALTWGRTASDVEGWWPGGVNIGRPIYGAIGVKPRKGGGHVTFIVGKDPNDPSILHCLGGNQGDTLSVVKYPASVFTAFMVPAGYAHTCCTLPDYFGLSSDATTEA